MVPEQLWSRFVIYVNTYYALQEAYDSARRSWERPADGLAEFCRDANPFLWDKESSAEEELYEGFSKGFDRLYPDHECTAADGRTYARTWLGALEGDRYGNALVSSFDAISSESDWEDACEAISEQLLARSARLARSPQDEPMDEEVLAPQQPSKADIEAVISLLSRGDEAFAESLRARLAEGEVRES